MSNSYTIEELINGYYDQEFSRVSVEPVPKFSIKHRIKMKRAFNLYQRKAKPLSMVSSNEKREMSLRKRVIIAVMVIVFMAIATGFVIAFISKSFRGTVYNDNTQLLAFGFDSCPNIIEKEYSLSVIPYGYELYKMIESEVRVSIIYKNSTNDLLIFEQTVKEAYDSHINTEGYTIQETSVNECDAICVEFNRDTGTEAMVIWNNKDYILKLHGSFTKNELIELANSNEKNGF